MHVSSKWMWHKLVLCRKKGFLKNSSYCTVSQERHNRWCRMASTSQFGQTRDPAYRSLHVKRYQSHAELFGCRSGAFGFRAGLVCKTPDVFFAHCGRRRTRRNPIQSMLDNKTYSSAFFVDLITEKDYVCSFDVWKGEMSRWCLTGFD